jgi:hemerythrin superfamily protein
MAGITQAFDKLVSSITPPESEETRAEARAKARAASRAGDWLSMILDHHEQLEAIFDDIRAASTPDARREGLRRFERLFAGHAIAEEMVVYPAAAQAGEKMSADMGYTEQTAAKMQIAALEVMDPMSEAFLDKLGHLEGAVKHHVHEEEAKRFIELHERASPEEIARVTARYSEEFERYMGGDGGSNMDRRRDIGEGRAFV